MNIIKSIITVTAEIMELSYADICSPSRKRNLVDARKIIVGLCCENFCTYMAIGQELNRDHSSIIYLSKEFSNLYETDQGFKQTIKEVKQQLKFNKINRIKTMKRITFEEAPPLWSLGYTDLFSFAKNTNREELDDCIKEALQEAGNCKDYNVASILHLATSNQKLVQELADMLFAYEIAFSHVHIPQHYGR